MKTIYVDADACPVKDEVDRVAKRNGFSVIWVTNTWMRVPDESDAKLVVVDDQFDAADNWIVGQIKPNDIVVTADIPLADRVIKVEARAIDPRGKIYSKKNIGNILATRDLMQSLRSANEVTGGPKPFGSEDRSRFLQALEKIVQEIFKSTST